MAPTFPTVESHSLKSERRFCWLTALGCFAIVIFFFSPAWSAFSLWARVPEMGFQIDVRRGAVVLEQVAHPGSAISDPLHTAIQWRVLFPLIGHVLHLPPAFVFGLADVGCVLALFFVITLLRRAGLNRWECVLAGVTLGAASWFFTATGWLGYFDSWLAFALLLVAFAQPRWAIWAACLWAPWVDERFVIAAPLAVLCRYFHRTAREKGKAVNFDWRYEAAVPGLLLIAFLAVRLGVLSTQSAEGATLGGYFHEAKYLNAPLSRLLLGVWGGLRSAWLLVIVAVVLLRDRPARAAGLAVATAGLVGLGLATAQDYSRSMTMVLPVAVFGLLLAVETQARWLPLLLRIGAGAALLLPAHHVMNNRVNPIFYLYHEIAAFQNPARGAMPEFYELRAIHEMERGEFSTAETDLTLAIKLSENPASPSKQRGILAASQNRWADALRDFSTMAQYDPKNPDAWFMRAQANLATGNPAAAQADLAHARTLAPADWATRPDVARFLTRLNGHP